jgi:two-component system cell cycle sensor histidine kinase/response regulator CckA
MINGAPAPSSGPIEDPLSGTETILLVEDEASVRELVARTLRSRGYQVITANNGAEAVDEVARHAARVHLVLTDVVMPEMSGRELFDILRGWYPTIRVLFMSGYARGEVTERELNDSATAFIGKPFLKVELATAIRRLLDSPRQPRPRA